MFFQYFCEVFFNLDPAIDFLFCNLRLKGFYITDPEQ